MVMVLYKSIFIIIQFLTNGRAFKRHCEIKLRKFADILYKFQISSSIIGLYFNWRRFLGITPRHPPVFVSLSVFVEKYDLSICEWVVWSGCPGNLLSFHVGHISPLPKTYRHHNHHHSPSFDDNIFITIHHQKIIGTTFSSQSIARSTNASFELCKFMILKNIFLNPPQQQRCYH